jgi:predicted CXXCH cytochrome family protein
MTKRILTLGIILIAIYLAMGGVALAGYSHGEFADNTDACAACHRTHTAISQYLLAASSGNALCETCHWGGSGADTDVKNGAYNTGGEPDNEWGDNNGILLAGGFEKVGGTASSTSMHVLNTALKPPGTTTGNLITLNCVSCHSPHMTNAHRDQYRLLRLRPNGDASDIVVTWNGPWTNNTQTTHQDNGYRAYTEKDWNPYLTGVQTITHNYKTGLSDWCVSCHSVYKTPVDSAPYNPGDAYTGEPRYRHMVDIAIKDIVDETTGFAYDLDSELPLEQVNGSVPSDLDKVMCLTCHRAHGTDATITARIVQYYEVDRGLLPKGSTLLRRNSTGVCVDCHTNI